jgi:F0F1-type ATP synthase membrane subunit c/vacuolar-type H+-ATPase subunit K
VQAMQSDAETDAIQKGMMTLWIMWAAMIVSILIYIYIAYAFGDEIRKPLHPDFPLENLRSILYGISIITIVLSYYLRKLLLAVKDDNVPSGFLKSKAQPNQPLFVGKYTVALMISLALSESIAIYGLVLFLLGADFQTFYIFTAVSVLSMFYYRPKKIELEELAIAMQTKTVS